MSDATANQPITRSTKKQVHVSIYEACRDGLVDDVEKLLASGADVNKPDEDGDTPLAYASMEGRTDVVRLLLAVKDIDVNKADDDRYTPLALASKEGYVDVVQLLLAVNDNDFKKTVGGDTSLRYALGYASKKGHTDVVSLLLAASADVNKPDEDGDTPLTNASMKGRTDVVRLLLAAKDIDVNKQLEWGCTPLMEASKNGHTDVVRLLLAAPGIDIWAKEHCWENTAFDMACKEHHDDVAQLIANAVSVDQHEQASEFVIKALKCVNTKAADTLLAKGAKLDDKYALLNDVARGNLDAVCNAYDDAGHIARKPEYGFYRDFDEPFNNCTFLKMIVENRDAAMFKALADRYVDINWQTADGEDSMLHTYVEFNDVRSIEFLLEHGKSGPPGRELNVNACNYNWYTPLMLAVGEGKTDAFEAIMRARKHYELDLECAIMNGCNETALTMACGNGNVKVVKMLLEAGAKPRAFDSRADPDIDSEYYGISPLQSCIGSNRLTMSKWWIAFMLMDHMSEDDWKFNELVKQKGEYSNDYDVEATVIKWHTLSRKWLPAWRISNFWWKVAGEGQHGKGGRGRKRSLVEYARDPIASKSL